MNENSPSKSPQIGENNVTPKSKNLVQQVFHRSMFLNDTTPKLTNPSNEVEPPANMDGPPEWPQGSIRPPIWQKVPESHRHKRKRTSNSPPQPGTSQIENRFDALPLDQADDNAVQVNVNKSQPAKANKPPPIIFYGIQDVNQLIILLETVVDKNSFTFKNNKNELILKSENLEVYHKIMTKARESGLIGHTFNIKSQRNYRVVIRNLHPSTPISAIKEEIEATGNTVTGEIINARYGPEKKPTSTFFVNLLPGPSNKQIKDLRYIYHQSVVIEDPRKKKSIVQCQRCQRFGHSKNYCLRPPCCVKCGQTHLSSQCKKDRNTPAECGLCGGDHPANYRGCEVYRELLARRTSHHQQARKETTTTAAATSGPNTESKQNGNATYAEAAQQNTFNAQSMPATNTHTTWGHTIEELLLKQNERFDRILQQMSAFMAVITKLVEKLTK